MRGAHRRAYVMADPEGIIPADAGSTLWFDSDL